MAPNPRTKLLKEFVRWFITVAMGVLLLAAASPGSHAGELPDPAVRMDFPPAPYPEGYCEDEHGNVYELPLQRYQTGFRPVGPCLPIGSWDVIRAARPAEHVRGSGARPPGARRGPTDGGRSSDGCTR